MGRSKSKRRPGQPNKPKNTKDQSPPKTTTTSATPQPDSSHRSWPLKLGMGAGAIILDVSFTGSPIFSALLAIFELTQYSLFVQNYLAAKTPAMKCLDLASLCLILAAILIFTFLTYATHDPLSNPSVWITTIVNYYFTIKGSGSDNYGYTGPPNMFGRVEAAYPGHLVDGFWRTHNSADTIRSTFCNNLVLNDLDITGGQSCVACINKCDTLESIANCVFPMSF